MESRSGRSLSVWTENLASETRPPLTANGIADVCVVGAGIAGLTTAYLLSRNHRVIVLDDGPVAGGETERTTGHITCALDVGYGELARIHGEEGARWAAQSHTAAIARIEQIVMDEAIDCGFERLDGYLFAPPGASTQELERELEAAHRAGLATVHMVERAPLPLIALGPALLFPEQAQFHPLKMTYGTIAGLLLGDLIEGRENAWESLYNPSRVSVLAGVDFVKENLNVAAQYADWVTPAGLDSAGSPAAGEGGVVRRGVSLVAICRDEAGLLHERSAVCPHLGCVVKWNSLELTWDCPCHGSRFSAAGTVVNGPANDDLGKA